MNDVYQFTRLFGARNQQDAYRQTMAWLFQHRADVKVAGPAYVEAEMGRWKPYIDPSIDSRRKLQIYIQQYPMGTRVNVFVTPLTGSSVHWHVRPLAKAVVNFDESERGNAGLLIGELWRGIDANSQTEPLGQAPLEAVENRKRNGDMITRIGAATSMVSIAGIALSLTLAPANVEAVLVGIFVIVCMIGLVLLVTGLSRK